MVEIVLRAYDEDLPGAILELDKNAIIEGTRGDMLRIESDEIKGFISAEPSGHGHYLELYVSAEDNITLDFNDVYEVLILA